MELRGAVSKIDWAITVLKFSGINNWILVIRLNMQYCRINVVKRQETQRRELTFARSYIHGRKRACAKECESTVAVVPSILAELTSTPAASDFSRQDNGHGGACT